MPSVTVRVEGAEELQAKLAALGAKAQGIELERAALAGAEVIRAAAEGMAPGPHIEAEITRQTDQAVEVGIGPDLDHWYYGFFETGTTGHPIDPAGGGGLAFMGRDGAIVRIHVDHPGFNARPFLRPAIDAKGDQAVEATAAALRRGISSVARG